MTLYAILAAILAALAAAFGLSRKSTIAERNRQKAERLESALQAERERDEADADAARGAAAERLRRDWHE